MTTNTTSGKTKLFISYSRKDREKVARIYDALEKNDNLRVFRDTDDILPTEEWKPRLEALIKSSDTILFCLSTSSAVSEVCAWEIDLAAQLNKRIIPVVIEDVDGVVPEAVSKLNYIFLTEKDAFEPVLDKIRTAISVDIDWIREHTRLGDLADRWDKTLRLGAQPLRGKELDAAEAWLASQPKDAPQPTQFHRQYIYASRKAATRRQRTAVMTALAAAVVVGVLGVFAWQQRNQAIDNEMVAEQQRLVADQRRIEAQTTESRFLSKAAREVFKPGAEGKALHLALPGLPPPDDLGSRPITANSLYAVKTALIGNRVEKTIKLGDYANDGVTIFADGNRILFEEKSRIRSFERQGSDWVEAAAFEDKDKGVDILKVYPEHDLIIEKCFRKCAYALRAISDPSARREVTRPSGYDESTIFAETAPGSAMAYALLPGGVLERLDLATGTLKAPAQLQLSDKLKKTKIHRFPSGTRLLISDVMDQAFLVLNKEAMVFDLVSGRLLYHFGREGTKITSSAVAEFAFVIGYSDGWVQAVNLFSETYVLNRKIFEQDVSAVAISADLGHLALGSRGGEVQVFPLTNNPKEIALDSALDTVESLEFTSSTDKIVALGRKGELQVWKKANLFGRESFNSEFFFEVPAQAYDAFIRSISRGGVFGRTAQLMPGGDKVVLTDSNEKITILRLTAPVASDVLSVATDGGGLVSSDDGKTIIALSPEADRFTLLDPSNLSAQEAVTIPDSPADIVIATNDRGKILFHSTEKKRVFAYDQDTGSFEAPWHLGGMANQIGDTLTAYALSADHRRLALGYNNGTLVVLDLETGEKILSRTMNLKGILTAISWSPSGKRLAISTGKESVLFDIDTLASSKVREDMDALYAWADISAEEFEATYQEITRRETKILQQNTVDIGDLIKEDFNSVVLIAEGRFFGLTDKGTALVFDLTGKILFAKEDAQVNAGSFAFMRHDLGLLTLASGIKEKSIWSVRDPENPTRLWQGLSSLKPVFSPTGKYAAMNVSPQHVWVFDLEAGAFSYTYPGHSQMINSVAFSADGRKALSQAWNGTLIWNTPEQEPDKLITQAHAELRRFLPLTRPEKCVHFLLPERDCPEVN